jgi:hypothetical protein
MAGAAGRDRAGQSGRPIVPDMSDDAERRAWVLLPATTVIDGIDLSLLDPEDDGDRRFLLLVQHPELAAAIENDEDEINLGHEGGTMSPRLHLAMHEVIVNQIWGDDPPEVWLTAQRLTHAGYDRHEVLHMLASVVSADIYNATTDRAPFDIAQTRRELAALPGSWEALRAPVPENRATRRAHARRREQ